MSPKLKKFAAATAQRVVRSFAASLLASLTVGNAVTSVDWGAASSIAATAALVTFLLCVLGQATTGDGPAFGGTETTEG